MVGCGDNCDEDPARVPDSKEDIEELPKSGLAKLAWLQILAEYSGVVDHGAADAEGISKMHGWHSCQGVNVIPLHPDALCVVMSNTIKETVFAG
jgi:hypothetical protein